MVLQIAPEKKVWAVKSDIVSMATANTCQNTDVVPKLEIIKSEVLEKFSDGHDEFKIRIDSEMKDASDKVDALIKLLDAGRVWWGDWGDWTPCDNTICNIAHRKRLCFGEDGQKVEPSSTCSVLGGTDIERKECCKVVNRTEEYDKIYRTGSLPSAYVNAIGSNVKVYQREMLSWVVSLKFKKAGGSEWEHKCGGVILSNIWVVTAAHCITDKSLGCWNKDEKKLTCDMKSWKITAGEWRLKRTETTEQTRDVEHIVVHNKYHEGLQEHKNDIALIKLSKGLDFMNKPYVQPSLLPARICIKVSHGICSLSHQAWATNAGCFTTGWGLKVGSSQNNDKGRIIKVWMEERHDTYIKPTIRSERIPGERPLCEGYSGSALMCDLNKTEMVYMPPQPAVVLGVNSLIKLSGCTKEQKNHTHTDLAYHMQWIADTVMGWIQWGEWSKCRSGERQRLRSGFFPEYGYLPADGPIYQSYTGDVLESETKDCDDTTSTTAKPTTMDNVCYIMTNWGFRKTDPQLFYWQIEPCSDMAYTICVIEEDANGKCPRPFTTYHVGKMCYFVKKSWRVHSKIKESCEELKPGKSFILKANSDALALGAKITESRRYFHEFKVESSVALSDPCLNCTPKVGVCTKRQNGERFCKCLATVSKRNKKYCSTSR
ncbi:unnamed protein product [Owenia fusiformis]|uniref:Peptidase S1 domain-containing protein n=1 Tax=Owenia fusiformis TaxID=6347 RepID=A0A8S4P781_OWEFU|nr:unnamed protein product [Owenia fusiformis]